MVSVSTLDDLSFVSAEEGAAGAAAAGGDDVVADLRDFDDMSEDVDIGDVSVLGAKRSQPFTLYFHYWLAECPSLLGALVYRY